MIQLEMLLSGNNFPREQVEIMKIRTYLIIVLTVLFLAGSVSALTPYECGPGYYPTSHDDDVPVNERCEPCPAGTYQPDTVEAGPGGIGPSVCTSCPEATEVGMSYCPHTHTRIPDPAPASNHDHRVPWSCAVHQENQITIIFS
jgi:hypothetical protein